MKRTIISVFSILAFQLLLSGCASPGGRVCEHEPLKVVTIGRTHFDLYSITNIVEETYYTPLAIEDNNGESVLKFSLLGAKTGMKWVSWGAEWPEISNHVYQTWSFVYRDRNPKPQPPE